MAESNVKVDIRAFAEAAKNAMKAGFDGIKMHGTNAYLVEGLGGCN